MSGSGRIIRIGTRGSPLALAQVDLVRAALEKAHPSLEVEVKVIKTSGDWRPEHGETRLSEVEGGKGLFAKEIQKALLAGEIDAAVHSMKDMDSHLPKGLVIRHMLPREDARDALLLSKRNDLANLSQMEKALYAVLPEGAVAGAASVRRTAFLKHVRPDINIVPLRGNVQTRIDKLRGANAMPGIDCTFLAMAGLKRLGLADEADVILDPKIMLPSAGQGAVGIETREDDADTAQFFDAVSDQDTFLRVSAERAALQVLDGSCHTPIGAYAELEGGQMRLRVCVVALDGSQMFKDDVTAVVESKEDAERLGRSLASGLKDTIPKGILGHDG